MMSQLARRFSGDGYKNDGLATDSRKTQALTATAAGLSLLAFAWPFAILALRPLLAGEWLPAQTNLTQTALTLLMPLLVALTASQITAGRRLDLARLAVLATLVTLGSVVRMLGAGMGGVETVFFIIVVGGWVLGARFGYLLGACTLLTSALLTGGIGPWLPFQMMAAGLVGLGAGLVPRVSRRASEPALKTRSLGICAYAAAASFTYGALMTMWNWPYLADPATSIGFDPNANLATNVAKFVAFQFISGGLLWDAARAATTIVLLWLAGPALVPALDRAARNRRV